MSVHLNLCNKLECLTLLAVYASCSINWSQAPHTHQFTTYQAGITLSNASARQVQASLQDKVT